MPVHLLTIGFPSSSSGDGSAARGEGDVCAGAYATSDDAHYVVAVGAHVRSMTLCGMMMIIISVSGLTHISPWFRRMLMPMVQWQLDINLKLWGCFLKQDLQEVLLWVPEPR